MNMNLNQASADDLSKIPGFGKERAQKLVEYRDKEGGFENWDDVKIVPGISESMINNLRESGATIEEE